MEITSSFSTIKLPEEITEQVFAISELVSSILKIKRGASHMLSPFFLSLMDQNFTSLLEEKALESLSPLLSQYLAILQQDDAQDLLVTIQKKTHLLDSEAEKLKDQFFKKVF